MKKLRDADAMLNAGQDLAAVLQSLEVSEGTYHRWRTLTVGRLLELDDRSLTYLLLRRTPVTR